MADSFMKWYFPIQLERMDRDIEIYSKLFKSLMKKNKGKKIPKGKPIIWELAYKVDKGI